MRHTINIEFIGRPEKVLFVKGNLTNEDNIPIAAKIEIKNISTNQIQEIAVNVATGKYASVVRFDSDYLLTVNKQGYAFTSEYFSKKDSSLEKPTTVDLTAKKIEVGAIYTLHNIYYATNRAELTQESTRVLDEFIGFLNAHHISFDPRFVFD